MRTLRGRARTARRVAAGWAPVFVVASLVGAGCGVNASVERVEHARAQETSVPKEVEPVTEEPGDAVEDVGLPEGAVDRGTTRIEIETVVGDT